MDVLVAVVQHLVQFVQTFGHLGVYGVDRVAGLGCELFFELGVLGLLLDLELVFVLFDGVVELAVSELVHLCLQLLYCLRQVMILNSSVHLNHNSITLLSHPTY